MAGKSLRKGSSYTEDSMNLNDALMQKFVGELGEVKALLERGTISIEELGHVKKTVAELSLLMNGSNQTDGMLTRMRLMEDSKAANLKFTITMVGAGTAIFTALIHVVFNVL